MKKLNHIIITLLLLISKSSYADNIDEADLAQLKTYNFLVRSKHINEVKQMLSSKKEPTYVESFLMALILQGQKDHKSAARWYANAAFKYKALPVNFSPAAIIPYMESGTRRSALYSESVYELSRIFLLLYGAESASKMLALLPADTDEVLRKKVIEFRVEIIGLLNANMAIEVYKGILRDYQSPLLYMKLGGLYNITGNYNLAIDNYFKVLEYPENDWTFQKTVHQLDLLFKKVPDLQTRLDDFRKTQMAEGYRIEKRNNEALALWSKIDVAKLDTNGLYLYLQNYCRLNINLRQFDACFNIVQTNIARLPATVQDKLYTDLGSRLFYSGQFSMVTRIIPETEFRFPSLTRLRALDKMKNPENKAQLRKESKTYLSRFDSDSQYAEGVFFGVCFEYIDQSRTQEAIDCLKELSDVTVGVATGGRARYFLARIYEKNGEIEKSRDMYKQVYLNSPEHFYAFHALRKISQSNTDTDLIPRNPSGEGSDHNGMSPEYLKIIHEWIAVNFNRTAAIDQYFMEKKKRPGFGVDRFWIEFENNLSKIVKSMSSTEMKASLFAGMGFDSLASEYLNSINNPERKFMILLNAGLITNDAYLKATNIQLLLTLYKKQADVMTLSALATDCLYPTPFRSIVTTASQKYNIEAARVYALMKQESTFHPGATSRSGAKGLMQIMPATAKWINKSLKIRNLNLYDPSQSIELGANFYSWLNKVSDGKFENMAIAYNAGPTMLAIWRNKFYHDDLEMFLEKIPVDETYSYVQKTRNYYDRYKILFDNNYPNLPALN